MMAAGHDPIPACRAKFAGKVVGILLAAGRGSRFDPEGKRNKLMQRLPDGDAVVAAAAKHLLTATPAVLAVVRPGATAVMEELGALGCVVLPCPAAEQGLAASLVHALTCASDASGWVIALGDMPKVEPSTIAALVAAISEGAGIAVPVHRGRRGNPVAFGKVHLLRLLRLTGDQGARGLLRELPVREIDVEDSGIAYDIDTPADLRGAT